VTDAETNREGEIEAVRQRCQAVARECGLEAQCVLAGVDADGCFRITFEHSMRHLGFDVLEKLSRALGSRDINLGCDCGTASDRSHDPYIVVRWPGIDSAFPFFLVRRDRERQGS
jgi:hypothetical protein